jgi:hypothetical protein
MTATTSITATTEDEWVRCLAQELDEKVTKFTDHGTEFWVALLEDGIRLVRIDDALLIEDAAFDVEFEIDLRADDADADRDATIAHIRELA